MEAEGGSGGGGVGAGGTALVTVSNAVRLSVSEKARLR